MPDYPKTDDPLVAALQQLLRSEGGHIAVGDKAGINDQSLYQIANCRLDSKTNRPKSVGPSIRSRLDHAFPGWLSIVGTISATQAPTRADLAGGSSPPPRPNDKFADNRTPTPSEWAMIDNIRAYPPELRQARMDEIAAEAEKWLAYRDQVIAEIKGGKP